MTGRRWLGVILVVVGLTLIVVGAAGAMGAINGGSPSTTSAPASSTPLATEPPMSAPATAAPSASPSPTPVPTPEPTADVEALVRAFFVDLQAALREGRAVDMIDALAPAVVERYGREACEAQLGSQAAEPSRAFEILGVGAPAPWSYETDGRSTSIPDAIAVRARVTAPTASGDATVERELHVQLLDGAIRWFSDCGTPLG